MAEYWQRGESIDYTNAGSAAVKNGDVISLETRIGVAGTHIKPGEIGSLHVTGVFIMPKATGTALTLGTEVFWDDSAGNITDAGTIPAGWVVEAAAAATETVKVKIG